MAEISDRQIADYFHRSYAAVDGLWFMKIEEKYGLDNALDIDVEVWKVLPKIQARFIKELVGAEQGIKGLYECFLVKLNIEGFHYNDEMIEQGKGFIIRIDECPWHNIMIKSGREKLSAKVGTRICTVEYSTWASEFDRNIKFQLGHQICEGSESCTLRFSL